MNSPAFVVGSCHFDWHEPIECESYGAAIAAARKRGFEATIRCGGTLVASWSPLYGTRIYDRTLAAI